MSNTMANHERTRRLVGAAVFTAIVFVLQFVSMGLRFSMFSITLVLMPVVVGAALYGIATGAWLGFVFGLAVLLTGDAAAFLAVNAFGTILTVLAKGTLAGLASAAVYKLLADKNKYVAVLVASIVCPVVNTGVFLLGCLVFFMDTVTQWAGGTNVGQYMIFGLVGINFLIEMGTNLILNPIIVRIIDIAKPNRKAA